jgi:RHS repeat-associated protein
LFPQLSAEVGVPERRGVVSYQPRKNTAANSARLYQLNATTNTVQNKNGLGIVLKVMAGDAINIWGKSYHKKPAAGYTLSTNPLSVIDLMNLLAASPAASPKGITGTQISGLPGFPTNVTNLLNNQPPQSTSMPRASINWVILDEQFKYVTGGFDMVGTATNTTGTFKSHTVTGITIPKNGYIYVYCSNESKYNVFFDNLQVVHDRGPILEETHYYPFGLTMSGISSKAAGVLQNKNQYNGKEKQSNEFSDGSGLELYDYRYRMQDPQIGRMWQIDPLAVQYPRESPYSYAGNNPISNVDVDGLFKLSKKTEQFLKKNYPKFYKYITSQDGILKMASNPKLLSAFEKLGFSEKDVIRDYTPGSGAEIRIVGKDNFFRGQTSGAYFGEVIEINAKMLDILEGAKTPEEMEAGLLSVTEVVTHEEGHRASYLLGQKVGGDKYDRPNNYTGSEDGSWLSEQIWGHLKGYYNFQAPAVDNPNFVQLLLNAAIKMVQNQKEEPEPKPEPPLRAPLFY